MISNQLKIQTYDFDFNLFFNLLIKEALSLLDIPPIKITKEVINIDKIDLQINPIKSL